MAAVYPIAGGRFGGSDGESKGVEGIEPVSRVSNLLIILVTIAVLDPPIRRFESFHPSHIRRHELQEALACGSRAAPRREG